MENLPIPGCSGPMDPHDEEMYVENELTNKFLSGEISFSEYSSEWFRRDNENDEDEGKKPEGEHRVIQRVRRSTKLRFTPALLGLMGEANLRFVRGDKDTAEKMCYEIIKQVPTAAEPYQTLAQIYEHDAEKSLQFSLLAAHLSKPDATEWLRLAAISKQRRDLKQEMICYVQAIKAEPHNLELHLKRLDHLSKLEEIKYPLNTLSISRVKCYHKIVSSLLVTEAETIMKYARLAANLYHNNGEVEKALEVMATAHKKCASHFTLADTNIYLELLISRNQHQMCIDVFIENLGVDIEAEIQTVKNADGEIEEQTNYLNCSIPEELPIDLKSKIVICFIHLGALTLVQKLLNDFLEISVDNAGDLYMDIEEALSSVGQHGLAMQLLEPLVKHSSFDLGAVWLKHAECLYNLGREEDAIVSYYKVLKHAPQHGDARRKLFKIIEQKGQIDEALNILQQDYKCIVSAGLLYEQACALKKYNKMEKFLEVGEALLSKTFGRFKHKEELKIACITRPSIDMIYSFRLSRAENPYEDVIHFDEDETFKLTPEQEWEFFLEIMQTALKNKKYFMMQRLTYGAMMSKNLTIRRPQIEFYCLQACLLAKDYPNAYKLIREHCLKNPSTQTWNLLNLIMYLAEDSGTGKYLTRLFQREYHVVRNIFFRQFFFRLWKIPGSCQILFGTF